MAIFVLGLSVVLIIAQVFRDIKRHRHSAMVSRMKNKEVVTDEEFLKAVAATNPDIALRCRNMLAELCDIPEEYIHPDDRLTEDLLLD